jgi:phospholipid/cholesterol/gamma-HCH transport system ATP-binding protein
MRGVVPQLEPTPGLPFRDAVRRRKDRVMSIIHQLPYEAQQGIIASLTPDDLVRYGVHAGAPAPAPAPSPWPRRGGVL